MTSEPPSACRRACSRAGAGRWPCGWRWWSATRRGRAVRRRPATARRRSRTRLTVSRERPHSTGVESTTHTSSRKGARSARPTVGDPVQAPQEAVGTLELQTLNGTGRPVHGGDVIVMVTNGGSPGLPATSPGSSACTWSTGGCWSSGPRGGRPLWEILPAVPPPRKPPQLR